MPITFTLTTDVRDNKNYYLEISKPGTTFKVSESIILKPVLPLTSCVYLIYLYSFFFIAFFSINVYFIWSLWRHQAKKLGYNANKWTWPKFIFLLILSISLLILPYIPLASIAYHYIPIFHLFGPKYTGLFLLNIIAFIALIVFYFHFSFYRKKNGNRKGKPKAIEEELIAPTNAK